MIHNLIAQLHHAPPPGPYLARKLAAQEGWKNLQLDEECQRLLYQTLQGYEQRVAQERRTLHIPGGGRIRI